MSTAATPNSNIDSREPVSPHGQADPWFRLALVMVLPVILLLVGISLTH